MCTTMKDNVIHGFKECGISVSIDGSEDPHRRS